MGFKPTLDVVSGFLPKTTVAKTKLAGGRGTGHGVEDPPPRRRTAGPGTGRHRRARHDLRASPALGLPVIHSADRGPERATAPYGEAFAPVRDRPAPRRVRT